MLDELSADAKQRMDQTIESVRKELAGVRTGRASLSLLDGVTVVAYGADTPGRGLR